MTKQPPEIQLCAFPNAMSMESSDPELWKAMTDEAHRQEQHIELIASENYTSPVVMQAQGSVNDQQVRGRLSCKKILWWL